MEALDYFKTLLGDDYRKIRLGCGGMFRFGDGRAYRYKKAHISGKDIVFKISVDQQYVDFIHGEKPTADNKKLAKFPDVLKILLRSSTQCEMAFSAIKQIVNTLVGETQSVETDYGGWAYIGMSREAYECLLCKSSEASNLKYTFTIRIRHVVFPPESYLPGRVKFVLDAIEISAVPETSEQAKKEDETSPAPKRPIQQPKAKAPQKRKALKLSQAETILPNEGAAAAVANVVVDNKLENACEEQPGEEKMTLGEVDVGGFVATFPEYA